jgi:hypothetical protein
VRRLDTTLAPFAIALVAAALVAGARLARLHGDPTRFVSAGTTFVDPARAPRGLHVFAGDGYDGQFFYRLALAPADLATVSHGIRLDSNLRRGRIGYPVLGWATSAGQESALPWALIALNVLGIGLLGWLGGLVARDAGRHPLWGLLPAAFGGFVFSLSRDLSEVVGAAALLGGLVLYRRGRPLLAGLALAAGVLTRESVFLVVAALGVAWALKERPLRTATAWVIPTLALVGWELVVRIDVGSFPLTANGTNLALPFSALVPEAVDWVRHSGGHSSVAFQIVELALVAWLAVLAGASLRRSRAWLHEKLAWVLAVALALCLSDEIYKAPADFRVLGELWILGSVLVLSDPRRRLALPATAAGLVWLGVAALRIHSV